MNHERQVYLLNPRELSPETIAVTFAKTSRSPESFQQIASQLSEAKSAEFNEKWVVGYGHASVAEHAVLHIAIENVSRLAIEAIESNRLASYTEKSTRYQKWDPDSFYIPFELQNHPFRDEYVDTCRRLFDTYQRALPAVKATVQKEQPQKEGESDTTYERRIRTQYIDVCRFLLPAASLANVGVTINARALEHALKKMLSHPLAEVREIGDSICRVATEEIPTLLKYTDRSAYLEQVGHDLAERAAGVDGGAVYEDWCRLVSYDPEGEARVLAAALYRHGTHSFERVMENVLAMGPVDRRRLAEILLGGMGRFDIPLRELEHTGFTFELVVDQGAYFEIKRHRMMTQTPQPLSARLGYATPRLIAAAGIQREYREAMEMARSLYERLVSASPAAASYIIPNGFNRGFLVTFNLREAYHFCALRSAENAHFSVRRAAQRMAEEIRRVSPLLSTFMRLTEGETWEELEKKHFISTGLG